MREARQITVQEPGILSRLNMEISVRNIEVKSHPLSWSSSGPADPEIQEKAGGRKTQNIKLILSLVNLTEESTAEEKKIGQFVSFGILYDQGRQATMKGVAGISTLRKIDEKELEEIFNDFDPIEAPPGAYKIQPEKQGE